MSNDTDNGAKPVNPTKPLPHAVEPVTVMDELLSMIKATVAKVGNTKKSRGSKRAYLRLVTLAQSYPEEDRDTVIDDLRRLMDKAGTDNDAALTAARSYVGTGLVG
jgi:hypothetical protein